MSRKSPLRKQPSHTRLVLILIGVIALSVAVTAAAVPLYRLFCQKFGTPLPSILVGPTVGTKAENIAQASTRTITVRFTANVGAGVPLVFQPNTYSLKVRLGQPVLTAYTAHNTSPQGFNGVAVHMLYAMGGPPGTDVSGYISLQQCFCFQSQYYPGNTQVTLPLYFTVAPNLPQGIHTITFAYTAFKELPSDPRIRKPKQE